MKPFVRPLLSLGLALLLSACGEGPAELVARADKSLAVHDFNAARIDLTAALRDRPGDIAILMRLARAQLNLGDGEGAAATVAKLTMAGGKGAELNRIAAEAQLLRGQTDAALEQLGDDASPDAWRIRGAALLARNEPERAFAAFERGLSAGEDPRLIAAYAGFALGNGDTARAADLIERLRRIAPEDFHTLTLSASLSQALGQAAAAKAAWRLAEKAYPHRPEPLFALAELLEAESKVDQALALIDRAAAVAPGDTRILPMRIQLLSVKGDWNKVRDLLQDQESKLDPRSAEGMAYAEALLRLDKPEQARALFQRAVLLSPENRYARAMLGQAQLVAGDAAGALRTLRPLTDSVLASSQEIAMAAEAARRLGDPLAGELTRREKSSETLHAQRLVGEGQAAFARRDWQAAVQAYSALLAGGNDAEVLKRLAFALSQLGRHAEAITHADRALAARPGSSEMAHIAGLVRLRSGTDSAAAVRLLGQAAGSDPANPVYRADLAKAKAAAG